jgi:hypothetical protein
MVAMPSKMTFEVELVVTKISFAVDTAARTIDVNDAASALASAAGVSWDRLSDGARYEYTQRATALLEKLDLL